jgi:hypothetical protein
MNVIAQIPKVKKLIKLLVRYCKLIVRIRKIKSEGKWPLAICFHTTSDIQHLRPIIEKIVQEEKFSIFLFYFFDEKLLPIENCKINIIGKEYSRLYKYVKIDIALNTQSGIKRIASKHTRVVHLLHSMASVHTVYPKSAFDDYDFICCAGEYHIKEFKQLLKFNGQTYYLLKSGYPVIDYISTVSYLKERSEKPTILYAPTWGVNNSLVLYGKEVISLLVTNYKIIFRPHPMNFVEDMPVVEAIMNEFGANSNFELDNSHLATSSLCSADLMISDYSGIAIDFAFGRTKKVIYLDSVPKVLNPEWNKYAPTQGIQYDLRNKIGVLIKADEINNISAIVESALNSDDTKEIEVYRKQYLFNFGSSLDGIHNDLVRIHKNDYSDFSKVN